VPHTPDPRADARLSAQCCLFRAAIALIVSLVVIKAFHLGLPHADGVSRYLLSVVAISYADVVFVTACWAITRLVLKMAGRGTVAPRLIAYGFVAFAAFCCVYAVVNVVLFGILGGFLTYPLLAIVGDVRMVRSSIGAHLTPATVAGLVGLPCGYLAVVVALNRVKIPARARWLRAAAVAALVMWTALKSDVAHRSDDEKERKSADDHMGLLTPVIKGVLTDSGFANAVIAQQIFGGGPSEPLDASYASFPRRSLRRLATACVPMRLGDAGRRVPPSQSCRNGSKHGAAGVICVLRCIGLHLSLAVDALKASSPR